MTTPQSLLKVSQLNSELMARAPQLALRTNAKGRDLTTFAVGGEISLLIEPQDETQLGAAVKTAKDMGISLHILGAGSNLLIASAGISFPVLRLGRGFRALRKIKDGLFYVGGSSSLMTVSRELAAQGFSGLEFAGGIPASVGGAVRMNAGAHGGEMAERLERVLLCSSEGQLEWRSPEELAFSYRKSGVPEGWIVAGAEIKLTAGDKQKIEALRRSFLEERKARQPLTAPCAGSVFKNPSREVSAGSLIEKAGLKGLTQGGAKISELHANWILNPERTALDEEVKYLIGRCREEVRTQFGVELVPEVEMWNE